MKTGLEPDRTFRKKCRFCDWYEPYAGVCCNGESEFRADFVDDDRSCAGWKLWKGALDDGSSTGR